MIPKRKVPENQEDLNAILAQAKLMLEGAIQDIDKAVTKPESINYNTCVHDAQFYVQEAIKLIEKHEETEYGTK